MKTSFKGVVLFSPITLHPVVIRHCRSHSLRMEQRPKRHRAVALASSGDSETAKPLDTFAVTGLHIEDYSIKVPLDWSGTATKESITVFYRVLTHSSKKHEARAALPYLLYLQGGPGYECARVTEVGGWIKSAVNSFRVVLMDQRGTGRSTRITTSNLESLGTAEQQAQYLTHFRADSIVRDAEAIRKALAESQEGSSSDGRWSILGQSFGGFCCTTYLSLAPEGLVEVLMTGGLPPGITSPCSAQDVYKRTFKRVMRQNEKYYQRFPGDVAKVQTIVQYLMMQPDMAVTTPMGNRLTPRSFQLLGLSSLGFASGLERLHYMVESAFDGAALSHKFLKDFDTWMSWDTNPLYCLLHESIYCQGAASQWAAHRVREELFADEFDAVKQASEGRPVYFTGEMVFPWMLDDFVELRKVKDAAESIAHRTDWPALYDVEQLQQNTIPTACASYYDDMFVDFHLAQETISHIQGAQQHISNEWLHDGIRENGGPLFDKLLNMVRGASLIR